MREHPPKRKNVSRFSGTIVPRKPCCPCGSCHRNIDMAELGVQDGVVSAALSHAAAIRRTLWMQEYKRKHGRALPSSAGAKISPAEVGGHQTHRFEKVSPISGPIYSTEYWRSWKNRSRAGTRDGGSRDISQHYQYQHCKGKTGRREDIPPEADKLASVRRALGSSKYVTPTSSFAGGNHGTQIFAAVSGGSGGDGLLRAHHDAVVQPLLKRKKRPAAHSSSSIGIRMSHNDPRPTDSHSSKRSAGDGVYDIALADKLVMRSASSSSFRAGAASSSETAIMGISRDTPGATYDPSIGGGGGIVPTTRFSPADRFPVGTMTFGNPGPGKYEVVGGAAGLRAVSWTGVETFMDSEWCRPVPPPRLRPWQGFGNGCSVQEHIDYGACLDGRCCTRHSVERRNALRVVQFLGEQDQRRSRRAGRRRHTKNCSRRPNSGNRGTVGDEGRRQQGLKPSSRSGVSSPLSPLSPALPEEGVNKREGFSPAPVARENTSSKPGTDGAKEEGALLRGNGPAGSPSAAFNSPCSRGLEESGASCSSADTGTLGSSATSADAGGEEGAGGACSEEARAAGRNKTPLHFASERGELALVDRLCYQGDDRNAVDERGYTPLHDAAEQGNTRVVNRLLQGDDENASPMAGEGNGARGAAPAPRQVPAETDVQDNNGRTPLYLACLRGHERAVRALLKAGASPDVLDKRGKPAQEVARAQRIYQLLQYKADVSLVKSNIAALEEREHKAERLRREAVQAGVLRELAALKKEQLRLRAAVDALEAKRVAYSAMAKVQ